MRARLALAVSKVPHEVREIELKNKPPHMLEISPKGTVPVLQLEDGSVIEESLEIMFWALNQNDPENWLDISQKKALELIQINDTWFKKALDRYKYPSRTPEGNPETHRIKGEEFLKILEEHLEKSPFLLSSTRSLADMAILPFIRQFAHVDMEWFDNSPYTQLKKNLDDFKNSSLFEEIMQKHPLYLESQGPISLYID